MLTPRQMWACALLLPPIAFLCEYLVVWSAPRFLSSFSVGLLFFSSFTVLASFIAIPCGAYFFILGLVYRHQKGELIAGILKSLACVCLVSMEIITIKSALELRHQAFVRASQIGDDIVRGLGQFRSVNGHYPERLDQLVPDQLDQIPYTGMIGYPAFVYRRDFNDIQNRPGQFELRINCPSGGINFDRFIYWPSETYPDRIQGNRVERIGRWAYMHE